MAFSTEVRYTVKREGSCHKVHLSAEDVVNVGDHKYFQAKVWSQPWPEWFLIGHSLEGSAGLPAMKRASAVKLPGLKWIVEQRNADQVTHLLEGVMGGEEAKASALQEMLGMVTGGARAKRPRMKRSAMRDAYVADERYAMSITTEHGDLSVLRPVNGRDALYISMDPDQLDMFVRIVQAYGFEEKDFFPSVKMELPDVSAATDDLTEDVAPSATAAPSRQPTATCGDNVPSG